MSPLIYRMSPSPGKGPFPGFQELLGRMPSQGKSAPRACGCDQPGGGPWGTARAVGRCPALPRDPRGGPFRRDPKSGDSGSLQTCSPAPGCSLHPEQSAGAFLPLWACARLQRWLPAWLHAGVLVLGPGAEPGGPNWEGLPATPRQLGTRAPQPLTAWDFPGPPSCPGPGYLSPRC